MLAVATRNDETSDILRIMQQSHTSKGFGIGGTATVYMKGGTYVDTQLQFNQVSADFEFGNSIGTVLDGHESTAMLISAEVVRRYAINGEYTLLYSGQLN